MLKEARADIMLSGGRSQFVALKAKMPWLDINQERHHAYAGYEGMVELVHEIDKALYNPIWEQVRQAGAVGDARPGAPRKRNPSASGPHEASYGQVLTSKKACTVNPLKMSQPIGGALAFMGVSGCMPLLHGSQGCTSFGLVLFVRHFREAIPLQTTAMSEVATVLGGLENVEQAIVNIATRAKPEIIGICSTGVTETKGDDVDGYIKLIRAKHPELADIALVYVSTPDFKDAFQDGWAKAVTRMVEQLVEPPAVARARRAIAAAHQCAPRMPSHARRYRRAARHHRGLRTRSHCSFRTCPARSTGICRMTLPRPRWAGIGVEEIAQMGSSWPPSRLASRCAARRLALEQQDRRAVHACSTG